MSADTRNVTVLILLDLTAAFYTVDHKILLDSLKTWCGLNKTTLNWFSSYLYDRTFKVTMDNFSSSTARTSCGVPQGSVLGLISFFLYMLPLGHIFHLFTVVSCHCYVDDSQLYVSFNFENPSNFESLHSSLAAIKNWMATEYR